MIRALLLAAAFAATPALAQHAGHGAVPASPPAAVEDPSCPAEHAAMGHCTPSVLTPPPPPVDEDPACPAEHAAMGHCTPAAPGAAAPPPVAPPSAAARSGPEHAADTVWDPKEMADVRRAIYAEHGGFLGGKYLLDRFEYRVVEGRDGYGWDGEAWFGGDYDRLWLKSEGEGSFGHALEAAQVQALYSRAIDPWFNLQAGIRYDFGEGPDRTHFAFGIEGLAVYWFEVEAFAFVSDRGDLTAAIEAEYDLRLTNQLILQPSVEAELSAQDVPALRLGSGLSSVEAGLRLRYELAPEVAPYIGIDYARSLGDTARFARAAGEDVGGWAFVAGVRLWF
ncbi:copper resistance protein B [Sphingoaurantiacus capsulatus]|uniref:Copper resistance protein B n=1 Tax=Sphingoaurantiacus capsulatus TaxID=1771310 RepID=A0ABV7XCV0_9SPHN